MHNVVGVSLKKRKQLERGWAKADLMQSRHYGLVFLSLSHVRAIKRLLRSYTQSNLVYFTACIPLCLTFFVNFLFFEEVTHLLDFLHKEYLRSLQFFPS